MSHFIDKRFKLHNKGRMFPLPMLLLAIFLTVGLLGKKQSAHSIDHPLPSTNFPWNGAVATWALSIRPRFLIHGWDSSAPNAPFSGKCRGIPAGSVGQSAKS